MNTQFKAPVLPIIDGTPYVLPGIVGTYGPKFVLPMLDVVKDTIGQPGGAAPLCTWKDDRVVFIQSYTVIPNDKLQVMNIHPKEKMISQLDGMAFYAIKVFAIKSKLFVLGEHARDQHGPVQQEMWHKIIGLLEPIFAGGWM